MAGVSALAAVGGAGFAIASAQDAAGARRAGVDEPGHYAQDATRLNRRARERAFAANVLVGGALVGAATSAYLLWTF